MQARVSEWFGYTGSWGADHASDDDEGSLSLSLSVSLSVSGSRALSLSLSLTMPAMTTKDTKKRQTWAGGTHQTVSRTREQG